MDEGSFYLEGILAWEYKSVFNQRRQTRRPPQPAPTELLEIRIASDGGWIMLPRVTFTVKEYLNAELVKQALVIVGNPNILVNIISRRVRQLTTGGNSRPLVLETAGLGACDIALREIVELKMGWEMVQDPALTESGAKKRRK